MGGYSFHWALPCAQVSVWSCRWWISLCWFVDEPWPGVIGFPFVSPPSPPCTIPPLLFPLPSPPPVSCCSVKISLTEGHSCVIVMQQGSAAWDDVNETAFSNEKLLWHVLKDKAPTVWRVCLRFSTFLSPCCFGILFLTRSWFFFPQIDASVAACSRLPLYAFLHFINSVNFSLKGQYA